MSYKNICRELIDLKTERVNFFLRAKKDEAIFSLFRELSTIRASAPGRFCRRSRSSLQPSSSARADARSHDGRLIRERGPFTDDTDGTAGDRGQAAESSDVRSAVDPAAVDPENYFAADESKSYCRATDEPKKYSCAAYEPKSGCRSADEPVHIHGAADEP